MIDGSIFCSALILLQCLMAIVFLQCNWTPITPTIKTDYAWTGL